MTEKDLEVQRLRAENTRLRHRLSEAILDINEILVEHELCAYCMYCDADCSPHGGNCVPKWRGL